MKLYKESSLRKQADSATNQMLDLWHCLSIEKVGVDVEVMIGDRKEHPNLAQFPGKVYAAIPQIALGKPVLVLWLDSLTGVDQILITHELGHWILKLQGFCGLLFRPAKHCNEEILINSMAHHPPLYHLQRSVGHEPQDEIDFRTIHNLDLFSREKEKVEKHICTNNSLMLADDLLNCSEQLRDQLRDVLSQNHPRTLSLVDKILKISTYYDLLDPTQNMKFEMRVIKDLKLGTDWQKPDEILELKLMSKKAQEEGDRSNV